MSKGLPVQARLHKNIDQGAKTFKDEPLSQNLKKITNCHPPHIMDMQRRIGFMKPRVVRMKTSCLILQSGRNTVYIYGDPGLTLTYFTARSNWVA